MPTEPIHTKESKKSASPFTRFIQRVMPGQRTSRWMLAVTALVVIIAWLINTPPGLEGKADAVGYALCHQISGRSFQINGQPLSLCARCTGMYVGIFVGLVYQLRPWTAAAEWPDKYKLIVLGIFFLGFAVDGSNSAYQAVLRTGAALLSQQYPAPDHRYRDGPGDGGMILPTFNQTLWKDYEQRPILQTWRHFGGLLLLGGSQHCPDPDRDPTSC